MQGYSVFKKVGSNKLQFSGGLLTDYITYMYLSTWRMHFISKSIIFLNLTSIVVMTNLNKQVMMKKDIVPYEIGMATTIPNVQSQVICIMECKKESGCLGVDYQDTLQECKLIYEFLTQSVSIVVFSFSTHFPLLLVQNCWAQQNGSKNLLGPTKEE